jgi:vitamin B12 transporter
MPNTVRSPLVPTLISVLMTFSAWPIFGQQPSRPQPPSKPSFADEVTVTATGIEVDIDEAPAAVTVITRGELDDAQADRVVDMLRRVPSVAVIGSGNEGKLTSLFTRGTNSNQTLVMLDGVRLNTPYFGGFDWSRLSTAGLEQIEIVRGPYSPLWGADAVGGVIHLRSRHAREGFDGRFFGEGGSNGWQRLEADIGWGSEIFDVYASGYDRQGDGELDNSDFSSRQFLATAGFSFGKRRSRLGFLAQNVETETGIPFASPGDPRPNRRQWGEHTLIAVPITWHISDRWSLEAVGSRVNTSVEFSDPDDLFMSESQTETTSSQLRLASHHHLGGHVLSWGGEWRSDEVDDASNFGPNLDGEQVAVTSVFLQETWTPNRALRLLLGVRWDDADTWGSETSPRVNLAWRLSERVELTAGYGTAFRPPSIGELYYPFSGNPELSAETSSSADLGFIFTSRGGVSRIEVTGFSTELDNLIEFDYVTFQNHNVGSATINGAEMAWTRSLGRRSASFVQAAYLDAEGDDGLPLLRRPRWSGTWTLHGQLSEHISGDLTLVYVGTRDDVDPITYQRLSAPSYATGDIALAYSLWNGVEVTARALNVFDEEYSEVLGYPAPGRRYFFGLRVGVDTPSRWRTTP